MMPLLIVAGKYTQARDWAEENMQHLSGSIPKSTWFCFIDTRDKLYGRDRGLPVFFVGTWWESEINPQDVRNYGLIPITPLEQRS